MQSTSITIFQIVHSLNTYTITLTMQTMKMYWIKENCLSAFSYQLRRGYIYIYIYICVCVCVCLCACISCQSNQIKLLFTRTLFGNEWISHESCNNCEQLNFYNWNELQANWAAINWWIFSENILFFTKFSSCESNKEFFWRLFYSTEKPFAVI